MSEMNQLVLYAEDEESDAVLLKMGFERAGVSHPLHVVSDGRQALDYLLGCGHFADRALFPLPALVLLDLNLPKENGFEILERVRQEPQFKDLPIIIFSSSEQTSDREKARQLGATDYFVKPHTIAGFAEVARQLEQCWLNKMQTNRCAQLEPASNFSCR